MLRLGVELTRRPLSGLAARRSAVKNQKSNKGPLLARLRFRTGKKRRRSLTSESWSFGIQLAARVSPFDPNLQFGSEGALESLTRTGVNVSQSFTYDTSGELTTLTTPLGGSFRWDYRSFTYSGSRSFREVQYRHLTKAPGAAETTYA